MVSAVCRFVLFVIRASTSCKYGEWTRRLIPDVLSTIVRSQDIEHFGAQLNVCGVSPQFLVIEDRGRNDNDCNPAILRDHRTVFDMKPPGGLDKALGMVATVLTRSGRCRVNHDRGLRTKIKSDMTMTARSFWITATLTPGP